MPNIFWGRIHDNFHLNVTKERNLLCVLITSQKPDEICLKVKDLILIQKWTLSHQALDEKLQIENTLYFWSCLLISLATG